MCSCCGIVEPRDLRLSTHGTRSSLPRRLSKQRGTLGGLPLGRSKKRAQSLKRYVVARGSCRLRTRMSDARQLTPTASYWDGDRSHRHGIRRLPPRRKCLPEAWRCLLILCARRFVRWVAGGKIRFVSLVVLPGKGPLVVKPTKTEQEQNSSVTFEHQASMALALCAKQTPTDRDRCARLPQGWDLDGLSPLLEGLNYY